MLSGAPGLRVISIVSAASTPAMGTASRPSFFPQTRELTTQNRSQSDRRNIVKAIAHALRRRRQARYTSNISGIMQQLTRGCRSIEVLAFS